MMRYAVILALLVSGEWPLGCGCCGSADRCLTTNAQSPACSHCGARAHCGTRAGRNVPGRSGACHRHGCPQGHGSQGHDSCPSSVTILGLAEIPANDTTDVALPPRASGPASYLGNPPRNLQGTPSFDIGEGRPVPTPTRLCCLLC